MCTQSQAIDILGQVYTSCSKVFGNALKDAYLYGSYARGDYHNESDIDILLTVEMDSEKISSFRKTVAKITSALSLEHDITVCVTVKPVDQFLRYANILPFYQNVIKEGIRYAT